MPNAIIPGKNIVTVKLDPQELLQHSVFDRDGTRMASTGLRFHHAVQGYAFACIYNKAVHVYQKFKASTVSFDGTHYVVTFADTIETLAAFLLSEEK